MAAKDYRICTALFDAYIAKISKKNPNLMTDDRRAITEDEIKMLIDWYLDDQLRDELKIISFNSVIRKGKRVIIGYGFV